MTATLKRIQLRLTVWYVGVFAVVLSLFGIAVFVVVRAQMVRNIDHDLAVAIDDLARRMLASDDAQANPQAMIQHVVDALRAPRRNVFVFDSTGRSLGFVPPPTWVGPAVLRAWQNGTVHLAIETPDERNWRIYGRRFSTNGGDLVAIAFADAIEIEAQYPGLLTGFAFSGVAALLILGVGGWGLARKSLVPIQRSIQQMRQFVADASHELRTPAAVLQTRAEVTLQKSRSPAEYVDTIRAMQTEAQRLSGIVDALLLLAASDERQLSVRLERVYLDDLLVDASTRLRPLASQKQIVLELGQLEEAPVDVDPALVRQLITILLDNAVKYTPAGGTVRVSVTAEALLCRVSVADNGSGIHPKILPHVFERFVRSDHARSRGGGVGLGLSIAKAIADAHGAHIDVQSTPGSGTTITVEFSRARKT